MSQMHAPQQTEQTRSLGLATSTQLRQDDTSRVFDTRPIQTAQRHAHNTADASLASLQLQQHRAYMNNKAGSIQRKINEKPNHTGLPDQLKDGIESMSGMSMDHVKVHYNSDKPAQLNAHAYAQGSDIHVAPGQEQHLPHEAWHVVQQAQGRVKPTMQMKMGVPVNDDAGLETEADVMGAKAMQLNAKYASNSSHPKNAAHSQPSRGLAQLFNIGWVPSTPATYRGTTTAVGNTNATSGGAAFGGRRYQVEADNTANAAGGGGMIPVAAGNIVSDVGGAMLPNYNDAANVTPECDHIIPVANFGANDLENGRMVSKAQNTGGVIARPNTPPNGGNVGGGATDVQLRLYTPINSITDATNGMLLQGAIPTGANLPPNTASLLARYATGVAPGGWANMDNPTLNAIQGIGVGTNNGLTIA